jgi:hypothetical protein
MTSNSLHICNRRNIDTYYTHNSNILTISQDSIAFNKLIRLDERPQLIMGIKTDITLYTEGTPNGLKTSIVLEELGLEYKVWLIPLQAVVP